MLSALKLLIKYNVIIAFTYVCLLYVVFLQCKIPCIDKFVEKNRVNLGKNCSVEL